jgi:hypothetical protein
MDSDREENDHFRADPGRLLADASPEHGAVAIEVCEKYEIEKPHHSEQNDWQKQSEHILVLKRAYATFA